MYDTTALKERINLVDLAGHDTRLRKVAATEYAGPCPRCGGDDRFHVARGFAFCRQCWPLDVKTPAHDAIGYVQWRDGVEFAQACELLGGVDSPDPLGTAHWAAAAPASATPAIRSTAPPPPSWQARAREFCTWAQGQLWQTPAALDYLHGRGLADDTIRAAGLGWNPRTLRDPAARWGLDGERVFLPVGLVIPCELGGVLWYVKVRQPERDPKYLAVRGSHKAGALYLAPGPVLPDMILTEGEINALSLAQALGPLCSVGSLGDAGNLPGGAAMGVLLRVARLWTRYDPDRAGDAGRDKLGALSARVRALDWPFDEKDPNDALCAGRDLAAWAVPQVGPTCFDNSINSTARAAWVRGLLDDLDEAAFADGGDDTAPTARLWTALYAEFERLGWGEMPSVTVRGPVDGMQEYPSEAHEMPRSAA